LERAVLWGISQQWVGKTRENLVDLGQQERGECKVAIPGRVERGKEILEPLVRAHGQWVSVRGQVSQIGSQVETDLE